MTLLRGLIQDERHGPLPALLQILTIVTGLVDAISYFGLGHGSSCRMGGTVRGERLAVTGYPVLW